VGICNSSAKLLIHADFFNLYGKLTGETTLTANQMDSEFCAAEGNAERKGGNRQKQGRRRHS